MVYLSKIEHVDTPSTPEELEAMARITMKERDQAEASQQ